MTEATASPVLPATPENPPDPRAGLTHVQRTDPKRLYREYQQYFIDDRLKREETTTGWDRLKLTWRNMLTGTDVHEANSFDTVLVLGSLGGFIFGCINDSVQRLRDFRKQHDDFVAAGLLKEKWQLHKVAMFRTVKEGVKMSLICTFAPVAASCAILSSMSYRNNINPFDFGVIIAATSAAFNIKKPNSLILRHATMWFGVGAAVAVAIRAYMWFAGTSMSEFRYNTVDSRDRLHVMMSRASWDKYKDMPQFQHLHEREADIQQSWQRFREKVKQEEEAKAEPPQDVVRPGRYKIVVS